MTRRSTRDVSTPGARLPSSPRGDLFRRVARRYWLVALALWTVATGVVLWIVPPVIRLAHGGRLGIVGRLIPGRDQVPVAQYLDAWSDLGARTIFVLGVTGLLGFVTLVLLWHSSPKRESSGPPLSNRSFALWCALWGGIGEGCYVLAKYLLFAEYPSNFPQVSEHAVWMVTVDHLLVVGAILGLLGLAGRLVPRMGSSTATAFAFPCLVFLSWMGAGGRVAPLAASILSVGLAVQLARRHPLARGVFANMVRRTIPWGALAAVFLGLALPAARTAGEWWAVRGLPAPSGSAPNVLLLILDTTRAQSMGLYGYDRPTTPGLNRFATSAVTFDRAWSTAPWTLPSHGSMFTGRWPHELDVGFLEPLDETYPTLSEVMAERGYVTGAFSGNLSYVTRLRGLDRGFHQFNAIPVTLPSVLMQSWLLRWPFLEVRVRLLNMDAGVVETTAVRVNRWFLDWQTELGGRPFFAYLNYFEPHAPYDAPGEFAGRFGSTDGPKHLVHGPRSRNYDEAELTELVNRYDEEIAYTDHRLSELIEALRERELLDNTIVIVTADHGEAFGEHGYVNHTETIYATTLHVPLLIRYPRAVPEGQRVPAPVSLRDLPSTVLELVGGEGTTLPGMPLSRFWTRPVEPPFSDVVLAELGQRRALIRDNLHYISYPDGSDWLFDWQSDPGEQENLTETRPEARAEMVRLMRGFFPDFDAQPAG